MGSHSCHLNSGNGMQAGAVRMSVEIYVVIYNQAGALGEGEQTKIFFKFIDMRKREREKH